jgi:ArsR family transcriptional regulator, arsenate/arsenite/antimonite-responsive transcriptional repressor
MSNKELPVLTTSESTCCTPLVTEPIDAQTADELSRVFKALADPVRLQLLSLIGAHAGGEACVCELAGAFELTQPTISHHLRVLREAGLIDSERRGTWVYYWVIPSALTRLGNLFTTQTATAR